MEKSLLFKVKRTLCMFLFMSFAAGFCGSCESDSPSDGETPPPSAAKSLKAGPALINISASGTAKQLSVTAQNVNWTATPVDSWVHLSVSSGTADAMIEVSADANESDKVLNSSMVITAEGVDPVTVRIVQAAKGTDPDPDPDPDPEPDPDPVDKEIVVKTIEGYWAGDYWGTGGSLDNVYLMMSDMEFKDGSLVYPGYMITLDLNIPASTFTSFNIAGDYTPSKVDVPSKSYTFNSDEVSHVLTYDISGNKVAHNFSTDGSVKITRDGAVYTIDLTFTMDDKSTFKATYSGKINFYDDTNKYLSTLTANCKPSLVQAEGVFQKYSDPNITASLCVLGLYGDLTKSTFDNMQLFLNVDPAKVATGEIEGEYTILQDIENVTAADLKPGTAVPGYFSKDAQDNIVFSGSWYRMFAQVNGEVQLGGMAPFMSGTVTVTRVDKEYTLTYSFVDDNEDTPHTISGTYKGAIKFDSGTDPDPEPGPDPIDVTAGGNLGQFKPGGRW